jgi:integrase/recombinase XerD
MYTRPTQDAYPLAAPSAIETIFAFNSSRIRQRSAPLLNSREQFLSQMLAQGTTILRMRSIATMLLHIIRHMNLQEAQSVADDDVRQAAIRWSLDADYPNKNGSPKTQKNFAYIATKWLTFNGMLNREANRIEPDDSYLEQFTDYIKTVRGIAEASARVHRFRVRAFLQWTRDSGRVMDQLTLVDIDAYVTSKLETGHKLTYVASICCSLRIFFEFARTQGWNTSRIAESIYRPHIPRVNSSPKGPEWIEVRRLLDHDFGSSASAIRAAAITGLSGIYALRSSEVVNLRIDDFDWHNEIVTIRRSKNDRVQQFPLQFEAGNKVIRYLKEARPKTKERKLFVTLRPPYRALDPTTLWVIVASRLKLLGIISNNRGIHSIRHACATRLLHQGTSLEDIADFLGHTNLKSVSIYAKHDMEALKRIAAIDLKAIL